METIKWQSTRLLAYPTFCEKIEEELEHQGELLCKMNLLLLLRSHLCLWGSPFLVKFLCLWRFFNPTIEVVTFRLRGWCMLGVFLFQASRMLLFVGCLASQQCACVSHGQICTDKCTCCHTETEATDQTFFLTQSQYTDTGLTSPSAAPITSGAGRVATGVPILKSLVWLDPENLCCKRDSNPRSSALQADALNTRPTKRCHLGLECQDLFCPCDGIHVYTD